MRKKLVPIFLAFIIAVIGCLTVPSTFTLFSRIETKEFPRKEFINLIPNAQNKGQRCKEKTVYYFEENGYTAVGEGVASPYCAKLQSDLKKAVEAGDIEFVKSLLEQGANVNSPNDDYDLTYPIIAATQMDNIDVITLLLDNGADINHYVCRLAACRTILMMAVNEEHFEKIKLLLDRGADVNFIMHDDTDYYTVFGFTLRKGNPEIIRLFENACEKSISSRIKCRVTKLGHYLFE